MPHGTVHNMNNIHHDKDLLVLGTRKTTTTLDLAIRHQGRTLIYKILGILLTDLIKRKRMDETTLRAVARINSAINALLKTTATTTLTLNLVTTTTAKIPTHQIHMIVQSPHETRLPVRIPTSPVQTRSKP
jgi:hypothetical protein